MPEFNKGRKVRFIAPNMGVMCDPLYWGGLWEGIARAGFATEVLTQYKHNTTSCPSVFVHDPILTTKIWGYDFPTRKSILRLFAGSPDVIIVNEFSPLSMLTVLLNRIRPCRARVLQLVENHPKYLIGYGKNRLKRVFESLRKYQIRLVDLVLTNNEEGATYLTETLKIPRRKLCVGPYLTSEFAAKRGESKVVMPLRIVAIGQLIRRKGYHLVIEELRSLPDEVLANLRLEIFGDGPDRESLQLMIDESSLRHAVTLRGKVPYADLPQYLAGANVCLISTLADYRSLASFEAISLGMPLVMSIKDGAVNEVLVPGENGWAYDPLVKGDLARVLRTLVADIENLSAYSHKSKSLAANFTLDKAVTTLVESIARLI